MRDKAALGAVVESTGRASERLGRELAEPLTDFLWGVGIESSAIPHLHVDQFDWTGHNRKWREDFRLLRDELGVRHLRYAVPWHYIQPAREQFDWSVPDERLAYCEELGIEVMLDVMHFGTPMWLPSAVGDPEFPESLEELAAAMVERYSRQVRTWCPINEPLVMALFSGDLGFWPPHSRKWRGYFPVLSRVALATARAIRAIRRAHPEALVLLPDAADHFQTHDDALRSEVALRNLRRFLMLDLLLGQVDAAHPLYEWMVAYGMSELDMSWFRANPQRPDMIGLDYYPHSDWQLEKTPSGLRQRRAESPAGLYGVAGDYYRRFGLPMIVTETSTEGPRISREVWLENVTQDVRKLRGEGVPLLGLIWWPLLDHLDWDGALTHRIGKLHQVGLFRLVRQVNGELKRTATPLAGDFARLVEQGAAAAGELAREAAPVHAEDEQLPPLAEWLLPSAGNGQRTSPIPRPRALKPPPAADGDNGNGHADGEPIVAASPARVTGAAPDGDKSLGEYGIVVFCHLRWGFVWQRPQQFLSRLAKKHPTLFVEEPVFDAPDGTQPRLEMHQVMPNVSVAAVHCPHSHAEDPDMPDLLRRTTREAIGLVNAGGLFDRPLLWYYSPADSLWSLGHFPHRGVVYDCMDELSRFTGAPDYLVEAERRLLQYADIVFTGGQGLCRSKSEFHDNVHFFGCGVEADHFAQAMDEATPVPPDIDFMARPILGWFGVIDERVDYHLVAQVARLRPDWSLAMVGPVVKIDPNLLPHAPNLYWLGPRDYAVLPNYCKAFDICMMCFAVNGATEFINPTKALEYLATGRPVISTPIQDVVRQYKDLMEFAASPEEFVAAAERLLASADTARIQRGLELAGQSTWEATVAKMQELIARAIADDRRRSTGEIRNPAQVRLKYKYVSTPGS